MLKVGEVRLRKLKEYWMVKRLRSSLRTPKSFLANYKIFTPANTLAKIP